MQTSLIRLGDIARKLVDRCGRVALHGAAKWESLVFIDPAPSDDADAFGDIDMRNG